MCGAARRCPYQSAMSKNIPACFLIASPDSGHHGLTADQRAVVVSLAHEFRTDAKVSPSLRACFVYRARKERLVHPAGSFDGGRRFYPAASENFPAGAYRPPSRHYPWSYMHACRTLLHVGSRLVGLNEVQMIEARRLSRLPWPALVKLCWGELPLSAQKRITDSLTARRR